MKATPLSPASRAAPTALFPAEVIGELALFFIAAAAQGDGAGALAAYQAGLTIREGLAQLDPVNTQWQVDVAASCAQLGSPDSLLPISTRKE